MSRRYFGTDGVRGTVGQSPMTPDFVLRLGYAAGKVLSGQGKNPAVLIGKDTRISGYMIESALEAGFTAAGIAAGRIVVDPGFGFGKTMEHNLELLRHLAGLSELPVLAGLSRKSMLAKLTGRAIDERLAGSLTLALLALQGGATILRVHEVKETRDVIAVWQAFKGESKAT